MVRCILMSLVLLTLIASQQARAELPARPGQKTPDALQGIWSQPDCALSDKVLILSRFFSARIKQDSGVLMSPFRPASIRAWRNEGEGDEALHYYRLSNRESYILKVTNDGLMRMNFALVHPKQPLYTAWGGAQERGGEVFTHCTKLFDERLSSVQEEIDTIFLMDQAMDACSATGPEDFPHVSSCHAALFAIADDNKDHALDTEELVRVYKRAGFLGLSLNTCSIDPGYSRVVLTESAEFSKQALERLDQDHSGNLSESEVVSGLSNPLFVQGRVYQFMERARSAHNLLPFLPLSDGEKICTNDPVVDDSEWTGQVFPLPDPVPSPLNSGNGGPCNNCPIPPPQSLPAQ